MNQIKLAARRRYYRKLGLDYDAIRINQKLHKEWQKQKDGAPRYIKMPERLSEQSK